MAVIQWNVCRENDGKVRETCGEENYNCVTVENSLCVVAVLMYNVVG